MKREFLQNFKVGDQPLGKEIIDAIMAENGRDIETAKAPFADYETIKTQLSEAQTTLKGLQGQDIETARKSAQEWENKYNKAIEEHKAQMADLDFHGELDAAIRAKKGRSEKAIKALLDLDTLKNSKNRKADIETALGELEKGSGYLFGEEGAPPPYASGTGTGGVGGSADGVSAAFAKLNPGIKL